MILFRVAFEPQMTRIRSGFLSHNLGATCCWGATRLGWVVEFRGQCGVRRYSPCSVDLHAL